MNSRYLVSVAAAAASFLLTASPVVPAQPALLNPHIAYWLSFDVTDSTYTQASAINDFGEVAGDYADANGIFHSFLRKADGAIVTFDAPGAGTGNNASGIVSVPTGINNRGDIVGYYLDSGAPFAGTHGFVRWANGTFTTFDDPSANSSPVSTVPNAISDTGVIVGSYSDTVTSHGFLRERDGSFITIDGPGTVQTSCLDINIEGEAVCQSQFAVPAGSFSVGVLRYSNGKTVTYNAPGAAPPFGTSVGCWDSCGGYVGNPALNIEGDVTGYYSDASGALHGYARYANGSFTEFMAAGDATFTVPASINGLGTVAGSYFSPSFPFPIVAETFVRFANGTVVLFNAPEAGQLGTEPFAINSLNEFTGLWFDANFVGHGFIAVAVPW